MQRTTITAYWFDMLKVNRTKADQEVVEGKIAAKYPKHKQLLVSNIHHHPNGFQVVVVLGEFVGGEVVFSNDYAVWGRAWQSMVQENMKNKSQCRKKISKGTNHKQYLLYQKWWFIISIIFPILYDEFCLLST